MKQTPVPPFNVGTKWLKLEFGHNIERGSGGSGVRGESLVSETYPDTFSDFVSFVLSGIVAGIHNTIHNLE